MYLSVGGTFSLCGPYLKVYRMYHRVLSVRYPSFLSCDIFGGLRPFLMAVRYWILDLGSWIFGNETQQRVAFWGKPCLSSVFFMSQHIKVRFTEGWLERTLLKNTLWCGLYEIVACDADHSRRSSHLDHRRLDCQQISNGRPSCVRCLKPPKATRCCVSYLQISNVKHQVSNCHKRQP